ncbi:MAG: hypothetical protein A2992_03180 [Elusimicrobia bacterium RIFCSPLOWO2_01_FULL_59_12]|nr:MAG: hypothetical protein A2992_03180 [Elusimicrobia bacterium RIFCSPLOWO2_01_FULL_59_12]
MPTTQAAPAVIQQIPIAQVIPSPFQTRKDFNQEELQGLAETLKQHGLLNPIIVRKVGLPAGQTGEKFELIAGERRVRAAKSLGWTSIDARVQEVDDNEAAQQVVVENLQRDDLNPIEMAEGYKRLADLGMKQADIARQVGVSQPAIAQALALLELPAEVQDFITRVIISPSQARILLRLGDKKALVKTAKLAASEGWSVKETERQVNAFLEKPNASGRKPSAEPPVDPFGTLWVNLLKEQVLPKGTWDVKYQRGATWVFSVHTRGDNPADVLSDWFKFMAKGMPRTSPDSGQKPASTAELLAEIKRTVPPELAAHLAKQYAQIEAAAKAEKK